MATINDQKLLKRSDLLSYCTFGTNLGFVKCKFVLLNYADIVCSIISWFYVTSSAEVSARQCSHTYEAAPN